MRRRAIGYYEQALAIRGRSVTARRESFWPTWGTASSTGRAPLIHPLSVNMAWLYAQQGDQAPSLAAYAGSGPGRPSLRTDRPLYMLATKRRSATRSSWHSWKGKQTANHAQVPAPRHADRRSLRGRRPAARRRHGRRLPVLRPPRAASRRAQDLQARVTCPTVPPASASWKRATPGCGWASILTSYAVTRCPGHRDGREVYLALELVAKEEGRKDASLRSWLTPASPCLPTRPCSSHSRSCEGCGMPPRPSLALCTAIKPENVLVGADRLSNEPVNRVRVTDFGLVKGLRAELVAAGEAAWASGLGQLTRIGSVLGTPTTWRRSSGRVSEVGVPVDIYALGCMVGEMADRPHFGAGRDAECPATGAPGRAGVGQWAGGTCGAAPIAARLPGGGPGSTLRRLGRGGGSHRGGIHAA